MHTEVLNISKNDCNVCQVETCLTFDPFVAHLQERVKTEKTLKSEFYKYVLHKFETDLCIDLEVNPDYAEMYRGTLELIYSILTPPILNEKEFFWALSTPVPEKIFFSTEAFFEFHSSHHSGLYAVNMADQDLFAQRQKRFIYNLILERMYGFSTILRNELLYSYVDPDTKLTRYYNIFTNPQFVNVISKGELPVLSFEAIEPYLNDFEGIDVLERILPLSNFKFEGFSVITLTDVTLPHAMESIRNELVNHSSNETEQYEHIINSLKTLSEDPAIEFGLMPFLTVNNRPIFDTDECSQSVLMSSAKKYSMAEETFVAIADDYNKNPKPIFFNVINDEKTIKYPFLKVLKQSGVKSYGIFPVYYNKKNVGILEVYAYKEIAFYEKLLSKLQTAMPLIAQLLQNSIDQFNDRIERVIKDKFTSLQPSVQWKFNEVAWEYLKSGNRRRKSQEIETVVFDNVYPLFGAIDIRNSTIERNTALQDDLKAFLTLVMDTLTSLKKHIHLRLIDNLVFKCDEWLQRVSGFITTNDELTLDGFVRDELNPFLEHFRQNYPDEKPVIDKYFAALSEDTGLSFANRRNLENSMQLINNSINHYLEVAQDEVQESYPCYFEKFRTDGVEYDIYIGQSIAPSRVFDLLYLKNIRLWQLRSMAEIARITNSLIDQISHPLQTTQLIFIHSNPIQISFRNDERRFDVEGAYNIRYEVVKKRIDKVLIAGTVERLTQPGKIAMVYFNANEATEYQEYIKYLQDSQILNNDLEYLDLEELQGVTGLKALRVGVNYDFKS
ncbi:GAF domain-containing protein [Mucilaginibacter sp. KACC 22773]|uniref:GAF domain-containing protein n=1 Tax=Mucilaginibacter sp. KACC 22773 TaxID=3025671 RepID=UPI0023662040|nr:GAF domain-containing protein [Mucilaginibacter sp. KACC 22773]WDF81002.1 GAF domain-containing protein [Mucilaginibacter sp. KACC 22773]